MTKSTAIGIGIAAAVFAVVVFVLGSSSEDVLLTEAATSLEDSFDVDVNEPSPSQTEIVFEGERFVTLVSDGIQWSLHSSVDGLEWNIAPVDGLEASNRVPRLWATGDGLLALVRVPGDETSTDHFAVSQDGVLWTLNELDVADGQSLQLESAALVDDELILASTTSNSEQVSVFRGPLPGSIEPVGTLPTQGGVQRLIATSTALFASVGEFSTASDEILHTVYASYDDGATWGVSISTPVSDGGMLTAIDDVLLLTQYEFAGPTYRISIDQGESWQPSPLDTGLFNTQTRFVSGDAGVVALTVGAVQETPERVEPDDPTLMVGGYTLHLAPFGGDTIVTGPNGEVIHSIGEGDLFSENNPAVRSDPVTGDLTFTDPETGDDLVTFTEIAIQEAQFAWSEERAALNADFESPERVRTLHFSSDGIGWTPIADDALPPFDTDVSVIIGAVGDDEFLLTVNDYEQGPPATIRIEIPNS